jgi:hypothetical protein
MLFHSYHKVRIFPWLSRRSAATSSRIVGLVILNEAKDLNSLEFRAFARCLE